MTIGGGVVTAAFLGVHSDWLVVVAIATAMLVSIWEFLEEEL